MGGDYIHPKYQGDAYDQDPPEDIGSGWSMANARAFADQLPKDRTANNSSLNDQSGALKNFLSIYAVTINDMDVDPVTDNNGTWEELPIMNGEAVRTALFGSGEQDAKQLIQNVWIGGDRPPPSNAPMNHYRAINDVLGRLGFNGDGLHHGAQPTHFNHFHIDLRPPERVSMPGSLLSGNVANTEIPLLVMGDFSTSSLAAINHMVDIEFQAGNISMFPFDTTDFSQQYHGVVIAQASQSQHEMSYRRTSGNCQVVQNRQGAEVGEGNWLIFPAAAAQYLFSFEKKSVVNAPAEVSIIQPPSHGQLHDKGRGSYLYLPDQGYYGKDKAVALVEMGEYSVMVIYFLQVVEEDLGQDWIDKYCEAGMGWKISTSDMLDSQLLLGSYGIHGHVRIDTSDLDANAVGIAQSTTITLDDNAAGHGWYLDYTPYLNEEYLPTSNPNEWIARPGSEAEGRMDLLSVLLHEYGHVLGLDHSTNSHDFMATTLAPGVRRLPTAEELAQLNALSAATTDPAPETPPAPGLPLGTSLGALLVGRLRRSDYGWTTDFEQAKLTAPQYEIAANPQLENPAFDNGGAGWSTTGSVTFTHGTATLTETATSQTRLNQVFVLGEGDRFLSFTLANTTLGDQASGPDDAFEVALLDANTGRSLLGGTGLTRNDAILNLQANGTEHVGNGLTHTLNADGSRTYRVDLANIPARTTVNLAFDLIGLGGEGGNSQLTLRDLHISAPQTPSGGTGATPTTTTTTTSSVAPDPRPASVTETLSGNLNTASAAPAQDNPTAAQAPPDGAATSPATQNETNVPGQRSQDNGRSASLTVQSSLAPPRAGPDPACPVGYILLPRQDKQPPVCTIDWNGTLPAELRDLKLPPTAAGIAEPPEKQPPEEGLAELTGLVVAAGALYHLPGLIRRRRDEEKGGPLLLRQTAQERQTQARLAEQTGLVVRVKEGMADRGDARPEMPGVGG